MGIYAGIVGACWFLFFVVWAIAAIFHGGTFKQRRSAGGRGIRLLMFVALLIVIGVGNQRVAPWFRQWPTGVAAVGAVLCVLGLAFASWARVALGRSWGMPMTLRDNMELITSGPYAYVRHPIYSGMFLMVVGTTLVSPFAVFWCAFMIAYFVVSVRREERDLERLFPDAWPTYKQRSKMVVPFVL